MLVLIHSISDVVLMLRNLLFVNITWILVLIAGLLFLWQTKKLTYDHIYRAKIFFVTVLYSTLIFVAFTPILGTVIWLVTFFPLFRITLKLDDFLYQVNGREKPSFTEKSENDFKQLNMVKKHFSQRRLCRKHCSFGAALKLYSEYKQAISPFYKKHNLHPKLSPFLGIACMYTSLYWYVGMPQTGIDILDVCNFFLIPVGVFCTLILFALFYSVENIVTYSTFRHVIFWIGIILLIVITYFLMFFGWLLD